MNMLKARSLAALDIRIMTYAFIAFTGVSTMFPGSYVPRYLCSPNLCSPVRDIKITRQNATYDHLELSYLVS